jgi:hypothetical protein
LLGSFAQHVAEAGSKAHSHLGREKCLHADLDNGDGKGGSKEPQAESDRQLIDGDCEAEIDNRKSLSMREQLQSALPSFSSSPGSPVRSRSPWAETLFDLT